MEKLTMNRRALLRGLTLAATAPLASLFGESKTMYGLINKLKSLPARRGDLIALLGSSTANMPGCLSYVMAEDASDADALWVTEVWTSEAAHAASLSLAAVKEGISQARPLIAGFEKIAVTRPVRDVGIRASRSSHDQ
jgi:quinol monooxygenase YgiN